MLVLTASSLLLASSLASAFPLKRDLFGSFGKKKLTFDSNGNFKVVSFSDMHAGERNGDGSWVAWGPEQDYNTSVVHQTILNQEKPSYVVFNGDMITGENVFKENATKYLDIVFKPTVDRNIPFSCTHGNHDNSQNITHQEEIDYEAAHYSDLSYTRSDVGPKPYGSGNYWVPVYKSQTDWIPSLVMWFFDSRSFVTGTNSTTGDDLPTPSAANYYWVDQYTVPAYIKLQKLLMQIAWFGKLPPALVFVHIPLQHSQVLANISAIENGAINKVGTHDDDPNPSTQGFLNNVYTGQDLSFWNAIVDLDGGKGNVLAVTSGHDHGDAWCARTKVSNGIPLCFNGHSGYGGYVTTNTNVRNGRVFNLSLKDLATSPPTVQTWNSFKNKTTADAFTLGPDFMKEYN